MGGIEKEPSNKKTAKKNKALKHIPFTFENDDTPKQLLARSRYIIVKNQMIPKPKDKSRITIHELSTLHKVYKHTLSLEIFMKKHQENS
jgi:hypothetical protein